MKYIGNPVEVDAFKITGLGAREKAGIVLQTEDMHTRLATDEMLARYTPVVGDYWVIQSDGYAYLNPAAVFERKYSPEMMPLLGVSLLGALEKSVKLQSHYANLLNMHDGGERMQFENAAAWIKRLRSLKESQRGKANNSR
jgi:hypothetical protein